MTTFKDNFEPGTVSHGTLHTEDLLEKFQDELRRLNPSAWITWWQGLTIRQGAVAQGKVDLTSDPVLSERASEMVVELQDLLDETAPEGYFFGAHEGDGSDFGFWEVPEEEDEPELPPMSSEAASLIQPIEDEDGRTVVLDREGVQITWNGSQTYQVWAVPAPIAVTAFTNDCAETSGEAAQIARRWMEDQ